MVDRHSKPEVAYQFLDKLLGVSIVPDEIYTPHPAGSNRPERTSSLRVRPYFLSFSFVSSLSL